MSKNLMIMPKKLTSQLICKIEFAYKVEVDDEERQKYLEKLETIFNKYDFDYRFEFKKEWSANYKILICDYIASLEKANKLRSDIWSNLHLPCVEILYNDLGYFVLDYNNVGYPCSDLFKKKAL